MSHVPGDKSVNPKVHFLAGWKDFIRLDQVRFINIVGSIQYGILYSIAYLFIGTLLHFLFPPLVKGDPLLNLFFWIVLQSVVIIIVAFYVQKMVEMIPGIISFFPGYFNLHELKEKGLKPYGITEYKGDMASSIVLIGTQFHLLEKVAYFTVEFIKQYLAPLQSV
jgi:hypothetical protein